MKTFQQFQEQSSLSQAFAKAGKPGIPSERPTSATTLGSLRANPRTFLTPLNQSSYRGREEAGRNPNPKIATNPNFQGPVRDAGSGTRDRMPGTSPQSNPQLPNYTNKSISPKPLGTNLVRPKSKSKPTTGGPITPKGTGGWV
jgi:hypothetical protein